MSPERDWVTMLYLAGTIATMVGLLLSNGGFARGFFAASTISWGVLAAWRILIQGHRWRQRSGRSEVSDES